MLYEVITETDPYFCARLYLKNPIVFIDLETTGVNVATDRIVEFAAIKINMDSYNFV